MNRRDRLLHKAHVAQILFRDQRTLNALSKRKSPGRQRLLDDACDRADSAMDALEAYVIELKLRHYELLLRYFAVCGSPDGTPDKRHTIIQQADAVLAELDYVMRKRWEFVVDCIGEGKPH